MIAFIMGQFPISVKVGNEILYIDVLLEAGDKNCFYSGNESSR